MFLFQSGKIQNRIDSPQGNGRPALFKSVMLDFQPYEVYEHLSSETDQDLGLMVKVSAQFTWNIRIGF